MGLINLDLSHRSSTDYYPYVAPPVSYSTTFNGTENPISESGAWITGADSLSTVVKTSGGLAFGTQSGLEYQQADGTPGKYNDSHAWLSPSVFSSRNQRVEITIHKGASWGGDLEVECLLGASVGALRSPTPFYGPTHTNVCEVNFAVGQFGIFVGIYRFLDNVGADLSSAGGSWGVPNDGDIFCAQLVLNDTDQTGTVTVSMKRGGSETTFGSHTDSSLYLIGQPGFGFYNQDNTTDSDRQKFCVTSFYAVGLP